MKNFRSKWREFIEDGFDWTIGTTEFYLICTPRHISIGLSLMIHPPSDAIFSFSIDLFIIVIGAHVYKKRK